MELISIIVYHVVAYFTFRLVSIPLKSKDEHFYEASSCSVSFTAAVSGWIVSVFYDCSTCMHHSARHPIDKMLQRY